MSQTHHTDRTCRHCGSRIAETAGRRGRSRREQPNFGQPIETVECPDCGMPLEVSVDVWG